MTRACRRNTLHTAARRHTARATHSARAVSPHTWQRQHPSAAACDCTRFACCGSGVSSIGRCPVPPPPHSTSELLCPCLASESPRARSSGPTMVRGARRCELTVTQAFTVPVISCVACRRQERRAGCGPDAGAARHSLHRASPGYRRPTRAAGVEGRLGVRRQRRRRPRCATSATQSHPV